MMQQDFKVSAIVSVYNSEKFIRGCLQDLIEQTIYAKGLLEIVVVETDSKQNERAIVEEFQQRFKHIVYIRTEDRKTIYQAWNLGIRAARGKYITNANTDDRHHPGMLERLANALDAHPEAGLVYAESLITDVENATWGTITPKGAFRWPDYDPRLLFKGCFMGPHPMWRKSLHDLAGYFDESFISAGDYEFWLRLSRSGVYMLHIPELLGLYLANQAGVELSNIPLNYAEAERAREKHWPAAWGPRRAEVA